MSTLHDHGRPVAKALVVLMTLAVGGCTAGADPAETPSASQSATVVAPPPEAGACYLEDHPYAEVRLGAENDNEVNCAEEHLYETIATGPLAGADPIRPDSAQARELYAECTKVAKEFLGADWFTLRMDLVVSLPTPRAWRAGAQWYRCDLFRVSDYYGVDEVLTTGSMLDAVEAIGCIDWPPGDTMEDIEIADCSAAHRGEVAGGFWAGDMLRGNEDEFLRQVNTRCTSVVLAYLGQESLEALTLTSLYPATADQTRQDALCVVWPADPGRVLTASVKDIGTGALPLA